MNSQTWFHESHFSQKKYVLFLAISIGKTIPANVTEECALFASHFSSQFFALPENIESRFNGMNTRKNNARRFINFPIERDANLYARERVISVRDRRLRRICIYLEKSGLFPFFPRHFRDPILPECAFGAIIEIKFAIRPEKSEGGGDFPRRGNGIID